MKRCLLCILILLLSGVLFVGCGGKEDAASVESIGFDEVMSANGIHCDQGEKEIMAWMEQCLYQGKSLKEQGMWLNGDGEKQSTFRFTVEGVLSAYCSYAMSSDESYADCSMGYVFWKEIEGIKMPYDIRFGDSLKSVLQKLEISLNFEFDFVSDEGTPGVMTLQRDTVNGRERKLQLIDRTRQSLSIELPHYELVYSESYDKESQYVVNRRITERVVLSFGVDGADIFAVTYQIDEKRIYHESLFFDHVHVAKPSSEEEKQ